jgi:hypothetical protein
LMIAELLLLALERLFLNILIGRPMMWHIS